MMMSWEVNMLRLHNQTIRNLKKLTIVLICNLFLVNPLFAATPSPSATPQSDGVSDQRRNIEQAPFYDKYAENICPTAAAPVPGSTTGPIYLLGDSLMKGMEAAGLQTKLQAIGYTPKINADTGRSITQPGTDIRKSALQAVQDDKAFITTSQTVVVELGTNPRDGNFATQYQSLLDNFKGKKIYLVDIATAPTTTGSTSGTYRTYNQAIYQLAQKNGATVIPWFKTVYPQGDPVQYGPLSSPAVGFNPDGIHPNSAGYQTFADLVTSTLSRTATAADTSTPSAPATAPTASPTGISDVPQKGVDLFNSALPNIEQLKPLYEKSAQAAGIEWEIIAAIHYREGNNNPDQSVFSGEKIGSSNPDSGTTRGTTIEENIMLAGPAIKSYAKDFYNVDLKPANNTVEDLQKLFIAWNRGNLYKNNNQPIDTSPYVMNYYSNEYADMRFPDTKAEPASTRGKLDRRNGALTMYKLMKNKFGGGITGGGGGSSNCTAASGTGAPTSAELSGRIVEIARREFALNPRPDETNNLFKKYSDGIDEPWCADFVSWVFREAGAPFTGGSSGGWRIAGVDAVQAWFTKDGKFSPKGTQAPQPGDIAIFNTGSGDYPSHVTIVVSVSGNTFETIGGNESDTISNRTHNLNASYLTGFGRR